MRDQDRFVSIHRQRRSYVKTNVHTFVLKNGQMDAHIDRVTYVAGDEVTEFAVIPLNLRQVHFWFSIFEFRSVAGHLGSTRKEVHRTQKHQHLANFVYNMIMYTGLYIERTDKNHRDCRELDRDIKESQGTSSF